MSEKLLAKCIEYGVIGESKEFLEKLEKLYDEAHEDGAIDAENICDYIESIRSSSDLRHFRDEQAFFIMVGLTMSALYELKNQRGH